MRLGARRGTCSHGRAAVNFMRLGLIAALFPEARIIHCRRITGCRTVLFYGALQAQNRLHRLISKALAGIPSV